jgi:uncharacterized OB-fold protein
MTTGVTIWRCVNCRTKFFPERLLCARCHGGKFETETVTEATIEEVSVIHHMVGQENWQPKRIASVRTGDGQRITIGLRDASGPGATVELFQEEQAPFGRAKAT